MMHQLQLLNYHPMCLWNEESASSSFYGGESGFSSCLGGLPLAWENHCYDPCLLSIDIQDLEITYQMRISANIKIDEIRKCMPVNCYLTNQGRILQDGKSLEDYQIKSGMKIQIRYRLRGGMIVGTESDEESDDRESSTTSTTTTTTTNPTSTTSPMSSLPTSIPTVTPEPTAAHSSFASFGFAGDWRDVIRELALENQSLLRTINELSLKIDRIEYLHSSPPQPLPTPQPSSSSQPTPPIPPLHHHSPFRNKKKVEDSGERKVVDEKKYVDLPIHTIVAPTALTKIPGTVKSSKPLVLKNVELYNGKSDFKRWIKKFEMKMNVNTPSEAVKLSTLMAYLSEDLIDWLAELSPETISTYDLLKDSVQLQYKKEQKTATDLIELITHITQTKDESVTSFSSRMAYYVQELSQTYEIEMSDTVLAECFVNGLMPALQRMVLEKLVNEENDSLEAILALTLRCEVNLSKYLRTQERLRKIPTLGDLCSECRSVAPTPGKKMCQTCYNKRRGVTPPPIPPVRQSTIPPMKSPTEGHDYSKFLVKGLTGNDAHANPLYWKKEKLFQERRCFHCAQPLTAHATRDECSKKYPNYKPYEIRALLATKTPIPVRSSLPTQQVLRIHSTPSVCSFAQHYDQPLAVWMKYVEGEDLTMIDTGASTNLITYQQASHYGLDIDSSKRVHLTGVNPGTRNETIGRVVRRLVVEEESIPICFEVVDFPFSADAGLLIGYPTMEALGMLIDASESEVRIGDDIYSVERSKNNGEEDQSTTTSTTTTHSLPDYTVGEWTLCSSYQHLLAPGLSPELPHYTREEDMMDQDIMYEKIETDDCPLRTEVLSLDSLLIQPNEQREITIECDTGIYHCIDSDPIFKVDPTTTVPKGLRLFTGTPLQLANLQRGTPWTLLVENWSHQPIQIKRGQLLGFLEGQRKPGKVAVIEMEPSHDTLPASWDEELLLSEVLDKISPKLKKEEEELYTSLLVKWKNLFAVNPKGPGLTTKTKAHVTLPPEAVPIRMRPYRTSPLVADELKKQVTEMLKHDIVRKSSSAWAAPVVMVKKSDGTTRFCVDYTKLNNEVKKDAFAIPRVDDNLERLAKGRYFTVLDLASGFWQIPMEESAKEKLAFITPFGNYEWNVLPFGFTNAPAIFQRAISETLDDLLYQCCLVYIDDIAIFSDTFEQHLLDCEKVFRRLQDFRWKVKIQKCQFAKEEVDYLGHKVTHGTISPLERNLEKLKKMKKPATPEDLRSLLGFTGYYKTFIQGYDYVVKPLRKLMMEEWNWTQEVEEAYNNLLAALTSRPILHLPDPDLPFIVKADTSGYAWGAALVQQQDGKEFPVAYASGNLTQHQKNWATWKRECYGAIQAILLWQHHLLDKKFTLITDHQALTSILDPSKKFPAIIARWIVALAPFQFEIVHRPGSQLVIEDSLSRSVLLISLATLLENQRQDPLLTQVIDSLEQKTNLPKEVETQTGCNVNHFVIEEGGLYYLEHQSKKKSRRILRLVLPMKDLTAVLDQFHKGPLGGHLGFERLWTSVSNEYWTPGMYTLVKKYYDACEVCAMNRTIKKHNTEMMHVRASEPLEIIEVDHMEVGVESNGFNYILTVVDVYSSKVWFLPTKTQGAVETAEQLLMHVLGPNRFCKRILTDHGTAFENELMNALCQVTGIQHDYNLPRTTNKGSTGAAEVKNKLGWSIIRKYVNQLNQQDWSHYCWTAAYAYNKSPNPKFNNLTPDFIFSGLNPFTLVELDKIADISLNDESFQSYQRRLAEAWNRAQEAVAKYYTNMENTRKEYLHGRHYTYKVGDLVLMKRRPEWMDQSLNFKLMTKNVGPYPIKKIDEERKHVYLQISPSKEFETHLDDIMAYPGELATNTFKPDPTEVIVKKQIPLRIEPEPKWEKYELPEADKAGLDIRSVVGKSILVWWSSHKEWKMGTVIGYTTNLSSNLVFYNKATIDQTTKETINSEEDYYKAPLFKKEGKGRVEKWKLLSF